MKTIGDRISDFNIKFIKKTAKEIEKIAEVKTVEDELTIQEDYTSLRSKFSGQLTPEKRRELALDSALFMKGTIKKNSDTFRAWFKFKRADGIKIPQEDLELIKNFETRTQIKRKFRTAGICADIWGDGYLLIKFFEIDNNGDKKLEKEVPLGTIPLDLILLNSENITEYKKKDDNSNQYYYHYVNVKKSEDKWIHPDRLIHIKTVDLPFDFFGVSKIDILRNILISSADIDIATGEILKWFSHGTQVLTKQGMQKNERIKALELLKQHPNYFAFSEKYHLDVTNPAAIDPTPYYDHISEAISAALIIPRQVLLGVEIGRVTGAEIGFADYYRDIKDNQELVYTPHIMRLYRLLADANERDFSKFEIEWEITYIDEMAEAELLGKRTAAAVNARSSNPPIISVKEARRMINEGGVELDPEDEPEEKPIQDGGVPPRKNPSEPQRPEPPNRLVKSVVRAMTIEELETIKALNDLRDLQAKKEKELGKQILEEQDKL
jgi:hypothetical protein